MSAVANLLYLQERLRLGPLALLLLELHGLVDEDLAVVGEDDARALERPGGRPLEVDPGHVEAAAVARALELVLRGQPVRRAAEVGAHRDQRVEAVGDADEPDPEGVLPAHVDLADVVLARKAGLEGLRGLEEDIREEEAGGGDEAARG